MSAEYSMKLLAQALGPKAHFRPGQWEAIEAIVSQHKRVLVVQRTGWGKSLVYFVATKILRQRGAGPTLLISPLLSLMRNQIEMADRLGLNAATINSANRKQWDIVQASLANDACDIFLISPERLNNPYFLQSVLPSISGRVGLLVVDEAHCISDWGHDFRPDYRRIVRVLRNLPPTVPVLATTATANNRVVTDIQAQLGHNLVVLRGPLVRTSLRLHTIQLADQSVRLAWLAQYLNKIPGTGIIYCLTVADTERVAKWLKQRGLPVEAYHAGRNGTIDRVALEQALLHDKLKALVATVALGMGFDKPDLGFVIHFQRPGSVVAYYQQVGRAGRAVNSAYGILFSGREDDEIQEYFIQSAFPNLAVMEQILQALEQTDGLSIYQLLEQINVSYSIAEKALKLLEVDGAVGLDWKSSPRHYFRTPNPWKPDVERIERLTALRYAELAQMQAYVTHEGCLMQYLSRALDDPYAKACTKCANCTQRHLPTQVSPALVAQAVEFLKGDALIIQPRKQWPRDLFPNRKMTIPMDQRNQPGRALCYYGDAGWGKLVREGKYVKGHFSDVLVRAAAALIRDRWQIEPRTKWVTAIPSQRHPRLVYDFAKRLAAALELPFIPTLTRTANPPEQKTMANSYMQAQNVRNTLRILPHAILRTPVLLIDDIVDSRWTMTMAGWLLGTQGSGPVYPFALACATPRNR